MNYSILLTAKRPEPQNHDLSEQYDRLLKRLVGIASTNTGHRLLAENSILLQLDAGLQEVADVVCAIPRGVAYTYSIFPQDTEWHEAIKKV